MSRRTPVRSAILNLGAFLFRKCAAFAKQKPRFPLGLRVEFCYAITPCLPKANTELRSNSSASIACAEELRLPKSNKLDFGKRNIPYSTKRSNLLITEHHRLYFFYKHVERRGAGADSRNAVLRGDIFVDNNFPLFAVVELYGSVCAVLCYGKSVTRSVGACKNRVRLPTQTADRGTRYFSMSPAARSMHNPAS